jgi:hypothetical protein
MWDVLLEFDLWAWLWANPWVPIAILVIIIISITIGINKGWSKLTESYNVKGDPLAPLGFSIKRIISNICKEDIYPVFTQGKLAAKSKKITWRRYWAILTLAVCVTPVLIFAPLIITGVILTILLIAIMFGASRIKKTFRYRHHVLMQMFEVANDAMRYTRGAELNPWAYIQIQGWDELYRPKAVYVMYPAKFRSEDERNRATFEKNFSGSVSDQTSWEYSWESSQNRVLCQPVPFIKAEANYKFPELGPWNLFPLGIGLGGKEVVWDVTKAPHCLVAGTTGSGKSVTQSTILLHALQSPEWRILLVDPKRVELSVYRPHPSVLKVATELEESLSLIENLENEMQSRYKIMTEKSVNNFRKLKEIPPAILLMVDETFQLLSPTGIKSEEGKEQDEMKARIGILLSSIARLGRAAGVHMVLATQRPDAKVLPGELKANLDARIAQGRMDTIPSMMTLDSDAATNIPAIKGRAIFRDGQSTNEFQAYYLDSDSLPKAVELSAVIVKGNREHLTRAKDFAVTEPAKKTGLGGRFSKWLEKKEKEQSNQQGATKKNKDSKISAEKSGRQESRENKKNERNEKLLKNLPPRPHDSFDQGTSTSMRVSSDKTIPTPTERSSNQYQEAIAAVTTDNVELTLPDPALLGMVAPDHMDNINDWEDLFTEELIEYWNPNGLDETLTAAEAQSAVFDLTIEQVRQRSHKLGRDVTLGELTSELIERKRKSAPETTNKINTPTAPEKDITHTPNAARTQAIPASLPAEDEIESSDFSALLGAPWMPTSPLKLDLSKSPFSRE